MKDEKKRLIDGFERFYKKYYQDGNQLMKKLTQSPAGAQPDFFVINCIDPRNGADTVFDCPPGTLFADPQMAAIVPPVEPGRTRELKAALRYAVDVKKVKHVIIMGHSQCGGCQALIDDINDENISLWIDIAKEAFEKAKKKVGDTDAKKLQRATEQQIVIQSLKNLLGYNVIKNAFKEGRLTVSGWYFEMESGTLHEYDPHSGAFQQIAGPGKTKTQPARQSGKSGNNPSP